MDGCSLRETRKRSSVKIEGNRDEEKEREEVWRNERRRPSNTIKKKIVIIPVTSLTKLLKYSDTNQLCVFECVVFVEYLIHPFVGFFFFLHSSLHAWLCTRLLFFPSDCYLHALESTYGRDGLIIPADSCTISELLFSENRHFVNNMMLCWCLLFIVKYILIWLCPPCACSVANYYGLVIHRPIHYMCWL